MKFPTFDQVLAFSKMLYLSLFLISFGMAVFAAFDEEFRDALRAMRNASIFAVFFLLVANVKKIERWLTAQKAD